MFKKILLATDGSPLSAAANAHAFDLAKACQAELIMARVVEHYNLNYIGGMVPAPVDEGREVEDTWLKEAKEQLQELAQAAQVAGVKIEALVVRADVISDAILDLAHDKKCDLIVMATHSSHRLRKLFLGSETQHVLSHSPIPVLVIPDEKK